MNQELERFEPAEAGGRILYEHLHRYAICRDRVAGQRVLDVACGAGYGTNILAQVAAHATGLDLDEAAIRSARRRYRRQNLKFVAADCCNMPFEDGSFDAVTANEMIEHIDDHDAFIDEVKRVLQPGGTFMVSTPNKPIYNRYKSPNPFHVSEMDIPEFRELLESHFRHVHFTGLRMALVSAGFELDGAKQPSNLIAAKTYRGFRESNGKPNVSNEELSLEEPEYVLALCSDRPIEQDATASTIFFSRDDDLWNEHEKIMAWASQLHEEDEVLRADLRRSQTELEETRTALEEERRSQAERTDGQSADSQQHLTISSRLLTRLTGAPVEADPVGMVEAMFALNEQLITQRARIDSLSGAHRRAEELEGKLEAGRVEREQLSGEIRLTQQKVDQLSGELETVRGERDRLDAELVNTRGEMEKVREQQRAAEGRLETFKAESAAKAEIAKRDLSQARETLAKLKRDLEAKESERQKVARQLKELTEAHPETSALESLSNRRANVSTQISSAQQRQGARLTAAHTKVRDEIAAARGNVRHRTTHAAPSRTSVFNRWTRTHPLRDTAVFDRAWVARQLPDGPTINVNKYLRDPAYHRIDPHPLFAAGDYLEKYPDVAEAGISALQHYLQYGWRESRDPHPFFANDWYLQQNPDVLESGINPLEHYLRFGWREGRKPNPVFDPVAYLDRNEDVRAAGIEPLSHYVSYGQAEEREVPFDGLERSWRSLVPNSDRTSLMEHLLSGEVAALPRGQGEVSSKPGEWPPNRLNDYWMPQRFRNFLIDTHGEETLPLYWFLYSVMDAYSDDPESFPTSDVCEQILDRVRKRSKKLASSQRGRPAASIIVPVYNNFLDTLLCLTALLDLENAPSFEIIVADDGSTDVTADVIGSIGGVVRHLRQSENLGFLGNCNAAAVIAEGSTIVLLNNDTLVLPGWLDGLLAPFDRAELVGFVGSKLINWDGTLQEAGGIFWGDGSAWNFGRGQDALDPEFNYLKDVDYCSGASIAVPTTLWRQLGGFDPHYSPAYCEDSDLAFRVRAAGYRTLYNPLSEVVHHEGRSHGRDTNSGIKAYQVTNQERLRERWGEVLARDHFPNAHNVLEARDRSRNKTHVLVIDHYVPQWDQDAGSRTIYQYLEIFLDLGFQVTFWPDNLYRDPVYTPALQAMGIEVIYGPRFRDGFEDFIEERAGLYDAVFLSRPHVADRYLSHLRKHSGARILFYGHDLHFRRMEASRQLGVSVDPQSIDDMREMELRVCRDCDVIFYPDPEEVQIIADEVESDRSVIANPVFVYDDTEIEAAKRRLASILDKQGDRLLFVGGFNHSPNREGIAWFVNDVLPLIAERIPEVHLDVAGSNPPPDIVGLASDRVAILGRVSDEKLFELYDDCAVAVAPLRYGAGVKGKVIEAMALGVPVATTTTGAQGIEPSDQALFIGDTAEALADEIVGALTDREQAARRAERALDFIKHHYGRSAMSDLFRRLIVENASA